MVCTEVVYLLVVEACPDAAAKNMRAMREAMQATHSLQRNLTTSRLSKGALITPGTAAPADGVAAAALNFGIGGLSLLSLPSLCQKSQACLQPASLPLRYCIA